MEAKKMKVKIEENKVFNLMDTNGRRADVINAMQGYLVILDDVIRNRKLQWKALPGSTAQLEFYKQAIEISPDVFQEHGKYDALMAELDGNPLLKNAIETSDIEWLTDNLATFSDWRSKLDTSVESRARHYTSTLLKLGLTDDQRNITAVGDILLGNISLNKDSLEKLLPLNDANIVYLRQLLKLKIFQDGGTRYYSPFCMALYFLIKKERVSKDDFYEVVQGTTPFSYIDNIDDYLLHYNSGDALSAIHAAIPQEINTENKIAKDVFKKYFTNRKSTDTISVYYDFYSLIYDFLKLRTEAALNNMLTFFENDKNKGKLNKAFGFGRALFDTKKGRRPRVDDFLRKDGKWITVGNINILLFERFYRSKYLDSIREYSDTTMRIFKATGLISFDNGYVELACRDLCECLFDAESIKAKIFGNTATSEKATLEEISLNESKLFDYYCSNYSLKAILEYDNTKIESILRKVRSEFKDIDVSDIPQIIKERRRSEFEAFIDKNYPEERVKKLLNLFSDRNNDPTIKSEVCPDSTVPTIYEYIVGIAWYYFSNKTIDLLNSFNLTLSANFEPLVHAGGGMGDIVIYEKNQVIMLEATLMNANSQKRGEWEPVLRHSINLKVEEESASNREVTTFFIADTFDLNTINIWKSVSSVPLQSSSDRSKFTENVIIMPISTNELSVLIDRKQHYQAIIEQVRLLFLNDITSFDKDWRDKFATAVFDQAN